MGSDRQGEGHPDQAHPRRGCPPTSTWAMPVPMSWPRSPRRPLPREPFDRSRPPRARRHAGLPPPPPPLRPRAASGPDQTAPRGPMPGPKATQRKGHRRSTCREPHPEGDAPISERISSVDPDRVRSIPMIPVSPRSTRRPAGSQRRLALVHLRRAPVSTPGQPLVPVAGIVVVTGGVEGGTGTGPGHTGHEGVRGGQWHMIGCHPRRFDQPGSARRADETFHAQAPTTANTPAPGDSEDRTLACLISVISRRHNDDAFSEGASTSP